MRGFKIDIAKIKEQLRPRNMYNSFFVFLAKKHRGILFLVFLLLMGYSGFVWYQYIYAHQWEKSRKDEYVKAKDTGVLFQRDKFDDMIGIEERRREDRKIQIEDANDFFRVKK